jgi:hypothetical protein
MKKFFVSAFACLLLVSCTSLQNMHVVRPKVKESSEVKADSVPTIIVQAFHQKYIGIAAEKWYKVNRKKYAVQFKKSGTTAYAFYTTAGEFKDEEVDDQDYYDPYDDLDPSDLDFLDEY